MYFVQHLLFPGRLVSADEQVNGGIEMHPITSIQDLNDQQKDALLQLPPDIQPLFFAFNKLPLISTPSSFPPDFPVSHLPSTLQTAEAYTLAVYQCLQAVDPAMAQRWHWRDIRKVSRSLQVFLQTGQLHSDIMKEQAQSAQETQ